MTSEIRIVNLILVVAGLAISIVGLLQVRINRNIEERTRRFFSILFSVLSFYIACLLTRELIYSLKGYGWVLLSRFVFFGQALLASILTTIITAFLLYQSGDEKWWKSRIFNVSGGFLLIYVGLLIYNLFSGSIYHVDVDNTYHRGPLFPVLIAPTVMIGIVNIIAIWIKREKLTRKQRTAFILYSVAPMLAMIVQARVFGVHFIALSTVISAVFMLTYIISDQSERYYIKEAENALLKLDILQAQIQPHFLFNSLTTIKHLCDVDPEKAQEAIDQFMVYLRHNVDSLSAEGLIDFSKELDHVKGYLALQKLRFGDDLSVRYDLGITNFKLPTLTLQPLVENAVTYGIRKNVSGKGTVTIKTRRNGNFAEVSVEDDGPGFIYDVSSQDKQKAHVGISNVRQRVESVAGGELIIVSEIGKGTKAIIRLTLGEE